MCECCADVEVERKVHLAAMDEYAEHFAREYRFALQELDRLKTLLRDAMWYNFDVVSWQSGCFGQRWYYNRTTELYAVRSELIRKRGHTAEKVSFPVYYHGEVATAPRLPPEILMSEVESAKRLVEETREACSAPYEWAPGGRRYEQMIRESPGVAAFYATSSDSQRKDDGRRDRKNRNGPRLGDPMEWEAEAHTEATAKNILGRVCGDRCLVSS